MTDKTGEQAIEKIAGYIGESFHTGYSENEEDKLPIKHDPLVDLMRMLM